MSGQKSSAISKGLCPATPFHEAAEVVLSRRLQAVKESLRKLRDAADSGVIEPDEIHQVRVGVRRAAAAMRVFTPCIGRGKSARRLRKALRSIRRSIGAARACDVSLALLAHDRKASEGSARAEIERLESILRKRRKSSIADLRDSLERYGGKRFSRSRRRLIGAIAPPEPLDGAPVTLVRAAGPALRSLLEDARRLGAGDLGDAASLHELRLSIKRLRYSTEVFGPCFDSDTLDEASGLLADVQDRLGAANDLTDIIALLDERIAHRGPNPAMLSVRAQYATRFESARAGFVSWWRAVGEARLVAVFRALLAPPDEQTTAAGGDWSGPMIAPITPGVNGSRV